MASAELDITDPARVREFAARIQSDYPSLNVLINNAGVFKHEDLTDPSAGLEDAEATVTTNLLGPIRLTAALLPLLQQQPRSTVVNLTSGLAFVPMTVAPTYCATKAALHSYTVSLRHQLRGSTTEVIELIPPYVQTDLTPGQSADPLAMPLGECLAEVMALFTSHPPGGEIVVELQAAPLRRGEQSLRGDVPGAKPGVSDAASGSVAKLIIDGRPSYFQFPDCRRRIPRIE